MDDRNDFISLIREKRELDIFLSAIAQSAPSSEHEEKPPVTGQETLAGFEKDTPIRWSSLLCAASPSMAPPTTTSANETEKLMPAVADDGPMALTKKERPAVILEESDPIKIPEEIRSDEKTIASDVPIASPSKTHGPLQENAVPALDGSVSPPETILETEVANSERDTSVNPATGEGSLPIGPGTDQQEDQDEQEIVEEEAPKKRNPLWIVSTFLVFIIAAIIAAFAWVYPDKDNPAVQWLSANVPIIDQYFGEGQAPKATISNQIGLLNVRQRIIKNTVIGGNIRVIEGMAENLTNTNITKIKILGELYDVRESLLTAKLSLCGNIVSDDNLANLTEEDIHTSLAASAGVDLSSGKIQPKGQIPFMIIFTREPAGVAKAMVSPIGFEKVE